VIKTPERFRDSVIVIASALVCAGLIFGLLYDVFDGVLRRWTDRDLNRRAHLIGLAVEPLARSASPASLQAALESLSTKDVSNLVTCTGDGSLIAATGLAAQLGCDSPLALDAIAAAGDSVRGRIGDRSVVATAHSLAANGTLLVVQDRTFLDARRKQLLYALFLAAELSLLALLVIARAGLRLGSRRAKEALLATVEELRGEKSKPADGPARLRALAGGEAPPGSLVVMANREPYSHERGAGGAVTVQRPASGLVTGIEPILRACGGTWIAYGSGSADRANSDRMGRVPVPPEAPEYTLRRLFIEDAEYERYYSGFANEGLWPLCHMAHTQPSFRGTEWTSYQTVNDAFARAAVEETSAGGMLLIQDYHFALVPRLVREAAPHVTTSLFWHIPWPNSEVVGICPWKEALLEGMLGADIVGFHTRQYCLNFLETVQRYLECRVDFEEMSVTLGGHCTRVRAYPISVEWPYPAASRTAGAALRRTLGISADAHVSVGVDRADYTKGLVERMLAVEQLLEDNPSLIGRYVLVQLASPTRTKIRKYQQLADDVKETVERINARFGNESWKPILLQMRTFSPDEVRQYYAMADSALVTPLHDGMNLVAKEYAAACEDGDGALVLSVFAGAAKELDGALLVNPYDTQQVAQTILRAIRMPLAERRARMQAMRAQIASHSIYDWSASLLTDMREMRQQGTRFWPQRAPLRVAAVREVVAG